MSYILIVDDQSDFVEVLQTIIKSEGFSSESASDGLKAIELLSSKSLDNLPFLIVVDFIMPNMDGIHFIKEIRCKEAWRSIPIVFCSGRILEKIVLPSDVRVLTKPFEYAEFISIIRGLK